MAYLTIIIKTNNKNISDIKERINKSLSEIERSIDGQLDGLFITPNNVLTR